jgi:MGT family glycosyltransferase
LITLGTTFNDDPNFFIAAAHAASRLGCLPIVVLGRVQSAEDAAWLRRLPRDAAIRSLIAFDAVLPHLSGAIHHGGSGTTHALVTHGVPQIVVPHAADQAYQAIGVANTGIGISIPAKSATVESLEKALAAVLPDRSDYRSNARRLKGEFAALGGVKAAASSIIGAIQSIPAAR